MTRNQAAILSLQYLPPARYLSLFWAYAHVHIERWEYYRKGSYRNRCYLAGPGGPFCLSIPLRKGKNEQQPLVEVRIAHDEPWQRRHWRAIQAAYGKAPFFPHFAEELALYYERRYEFLFDFNLELMHYLRQTLGAPAALHFTPEYRADPPAGFADWRERIHPKREAAADSYFNMTPYAQVFMEKTGFIPNLSILDLLMCRGPEAAAILAHSFKHPKNDAL
jgi:hypothetical protein